MATRTKTVIVLGVSMAVALLILLLWMQTDDEGAARDSDGTVNAPIQNVNDALEPSRTPKLNPTEARNTVATGTGAEPNPDAPQIEPPPKSIPPLRTVLFRIPLSATLAGECIDASSLRSAVGGRSTDQLPGGTGYAWVFRLASANKPSAADADTNGAAVITPVQRSRESDGDSCMIEGRWSADQGQAYSIVIDWMGGLDGNELLPPSARASSLTAALHPLLVTHTSEFEPERGTPLRYILTEPRITSYRDGTATVEFAPVVITLESFLGEGLIGHGKFIDPTDQRSVALPFADVSIRSKRGDSMRGWGTLTSAVFSGVDGRFWFLMKPTPDDALPAEVLTLDDPDVPNATRLSPFRIGVGPAWTQDGHNDWNQFYLPRPVQTGRVLDFGIVPYLLPTIEIQVARHPENWPYTGPTLDEPLTILALQTTSALLPRSFSYSLPPAPDPAPATLRAPLLGFCTGWGDVTVSGTMRENFVLSEAEPLVVADVKTKRHNIVLRPSWSSTRTIRVRHQGAGLSSAVVLAVPNYASHYDATNPPAPTDELYFRMLQQGWGESLDAVQLPHTLPFSTGTSTAVWYMASVPNFAPAAVLIPNEHVGEVVIDLHKELTEVALEFAWEDLSPLVEQAIRTRRNAGLEPRAYFNLIASNTSGEPRTTLASAIDLPVGGVHRLTRMLDPDASWTFKLELDLNRYQAISIPVYQFPEISITAPIQSKTVVRVASIPAPSYALPNASNLKPTVAGFYAEEWSAWADSIHLTLEGSPTNARPKMCNRDRRRAAKILPFGYNDGDRVVPLSYSLGAGGRGIRASADLPARIEVSLSSDFPTEAEAWITVYEGDTRIQSALVAPGSITRLYAPVGEIRLTCGLSRGGGIQQVIDKWGEGSPDQMRFDAKWEETLTISRDQIARVKFPKQ